MLPIHIFVCTIWCLASAVTIVVKSQELDNQILVTGEVTLTDCQIKDFSRWDKLFTMLENSHMRQNMLIQYFEEAKEDLEKERATKSAQSCSNCIKNMTSEIADILQTTCQPDATLRKYAETTITLNLEIAERLDRIESDLKKVNNSKCTNTEDLEDEDEDEETTKALIDFILKTKAWISKSQLPSGCDVAVLFPMRSPKIYASVHPARMNLQAFTFCVWTKVTESLEKTIVLSYGTKRNPYEIQLYLNKQSPVLIIGGDSNKIHTDNVLQEGEWSHLCGTWNSEDGSTALWINGENSATSNALAVGHVIPDRGIFQLGQEKNGCCVGGGFDESLSFSGKITGFNLWDKVLDEDDIIKSGAEGGCSFRGNIVGWGTTEIQPHGGAQYIH
ncbi:pentraxin-related protein PTX3 [Pseudophryne corroboree]|uniref:pentraxin-related protein PTX3 n=1 Tax=Pseudophryne corroboree TaxID=495146 RepID=UPI0030816E77